MGSLCIFLLVSPQASKCEPATAVEFTDGCVCVFSRGLREQECSELEEQSHGALALEREVVVGLLVTAL